MSKSSVGVIIAVVILVIIAGFLLSAKRGTPEPVATITDFASCVEAGNPVLETYPPQCKTSDGKIFTEDIGNELEKADLIRVSRPRPNQVIQSPLVIEGEARGTWFFEGSFPVALRDREANNVATGIAQAQGEWMTEDFVPFKATLEFQKPAAKGGKLVLSKENPSGRRDLDDELVIPILFED